MQPPMRYCAIYSFTLHNFKQIKEIKWTPAVHFINKAEYIKAGLLALEGPQVKYAPVLANPGVHENCSQV